MDDLRPTEYPQPITRPSKTLEALPYRNNPYRNNPYEIAPPPPLPNTPVIIEKAKGMWVAELLGVALLVGIGLVAIYAASNYWYMQGYQNGNIDGQNAHTQEYNNGYTQGKADGYDNGFQAGKTAGYNSGYADGKNDGENQSYSDLYDYVKGKDSTGEPCLHTSDQPDYVYFRVYKDKSGTINYNCLL